MSINTTCPGCKSLFRLPEELAGKTVRCQKCAQLFVVPGPPAADPEPSAEAPEPPPDQPLAS